ncbi:MAG: SCO family protein [Gammaproteobacteria bacterium]
MRGIIIALLASLAACAPPPAPFNATEVTGVSYGTKLQIPDTQGKLRSLTEFSGKVTLVFFGFASCPDICPSTLMRLGQLRKQLGTDGAAVQVILVTVDPERDTAPRLEAYVKNFDPSFIGLRPTPAELESVVKAFHAIAIKVPMSNGADYTIDHSSTIYVYDLNTRMRLIARPDMPIEQLAADLRRLLADS